jgi:alpha-1,2-mannosyltransferase
VICVGSLVLTVRLAEAMAERLYPGATRGRNLIWLRSVSLFFCSKHIPDVLNYQAYEAPALAMVTLGIWALTVGRQAPGGFWLGASAAIRATPLIYLPYLLLKRRYLACATFAVCFVAISFLPDAISALRGGHTGYIQDWVRQIAGPAMAPGTHSNLRFWDTWTGHNLNNQSLRGLINRFVAGPIFGLSPTMILAAVDGVFGLMVAALLLISPRQKEYAAIDGAVLLIAMLALSPMTSRYHFVLVLPAVVLVVAAVINDTRMRIFGSVVLAASFMLLTGTSNDLTAPLFGEFPYVYGFMTEGAIVLLAALGMMAGAWRPPGVAAGESHALEQPPAYGARTNSFTR